MVSAQRPQIGLISGPMILALRDVSKAVRTGPTISRYEQDKTNVANEDSALKEVDQELAEERQWVMFQKYGPMVLGGAAAIILAVGGWQFWNVRQDAAAGQTALEFRNAVDLLAENADDGRTALLAIEEEGAGGYGVLAALHRAASFARGGERLAAVNAYREIYNNSSTPQNIRGLARLRAGYLSISDGRDAVMIDIGDLLGGDSAYVFLAREISGLAALQAGDYETALSLFQQLSADIGAPSSLSERAEDLAALAQSAKDGVNITGEARIEDLLSVIGESVEEASASDEGEEDKNLDATGAEAEDASKDSASSDADTDTATDNNENE